MVGFGERSVLQGEGIPLRFHLRQLQVKVDVVTQNFGNGRPILTLLEREFHLVLVLLFGQLPFKFGHPVAEAVILLLKVLLELSKNRADTVSDSFGKASA